MSSLSFLTHAQFLTITPRGIHTTDLTLYPLFGDSALRPIAQVGQVRSGQTALLELDPSLLPGEFAIRYDYRANASDAPYPSEQYVIIGRQGLRILLNPVYTGKSDSVSLLDDGGENEAWQTFLADNAIRRAPVERMRQWLDEEPASRKAYYRQFVKEYTRRRQAYLDWLEGRKVAHADMLASRLMSFSGIPAPAAAGESRATQAVRHLSVLNLQDSLLLHTRFFAQYLDGFVQAGLQQLASPASADSVILSLTAGLLEAASVASPRVYGAVTDYLYLQFLRSGIDAGMELLARHLVRPACQSRNKEAITRKLAAMGKVQVGLSAIDVEIPLAGKAPARLSQLTEGRPMSLLLFWSAGCSHCLELVDRLSRYTQQQEIGRQLQVIAVSVDRSEADRSKWSAMTPGLLQWRHAQCPEGPSSEAARAFGVLATPTMFLIDGSFHIRGIPQSMDELIQILAS